MPCRYFKDEKELSGDELQSFMRSVPHDQKLKIAPEIAKDSYQALSWTPGEAQAARYDLSKQISSIDYQKQPNGTYSLGIFDKSGQAVDGLEKDFKPEELSNVVGKEIAQKIIGDNPSAKIRAGTLEGLDLKVGGEGMKAFYDKMLVDKANAIAKKYGGKVEEKNINVRKKIYNVVDGMGNILRQFDKATDANAFIKENPRTRQQGQITEGGSQPIHFLRLPQSLKDTAQQKGFPLFSSGVMLQPVIGNPFGNKHWLKPVDYNPFTDS